MRRKNVSTRLHKSTKAINTNCHRRTLKKPNYQKKQKGGDAIINVYINPNNIKDLLNTENNIILPNLISKTSINYNTTLKKINIDNPINDIKKCITTYHNILGQLCCGSHSMSGFNFLEIIDEDNLNRIWSFIDVDKDKHNNTDILPKSINGYDDLIKFIKYMHNLFISPSIIKKKTKTFGIFKNIKELPADLQNIISTSLKSAVYNINCTNTLHQTETPPQQVHQAPQQVHQAPQQVHQAPQQVHQAPQQVHQAPQALAQQVQALAPQALALQEQALALQEQALQEQAQALQEQAQALQEQALAPQAQEPAQQEPVPEEPAPQAPAPQAPAQQAPTQEEPAPQKPESQPQAPISSGTLGSSGDGTGKVSRVKEVAKKVGTAALSGIRSFGTGTISFFKRGAKAIASKLTQKAAIGGKHITRTQHKKYYKYPIKATNHKTQKKHKPNHKMTMKRKVRC